MTAPAIDFDDLRAQLARSTVSATTMNFIVWVDDATFRPWVVDRMAQILEKHPARALLLDACPDRAPGATVVRCVPSDEEARITVDSERVEIGVAGMTAQAIAELTSSLTINELSTLVWWTGEGIRGQDAFNALVEQADFLVVDSSGTRNDSATVIELVRFQESRPTVVVRDLAYLRLRPWQDMIARFFDDPRLAEELYSVRSLRIVSGSDAEALYLSGWLASRLGWTASGHDEFSDQSGARIPFSSERAGRKRRVRSVELTTASSTYTATVSDDDEGIAIVKSAGANATPGRFVPLAAVDSASVLERAILLASIDDIFEKALHMVGTLTA